MACKINPAVALGNLRDRFMHGAVTTVLGFRVFGVSGQLDLGVQCPRLVVLDEWNLVVAMAETLCGGEAKFLQSSFDLDISGIHWRFQGHQFRQFFNCMWN